MPTKKPSLKKLVARKQPSQLRSRAKVEEILNATRNILINDGLEKLTTNLVAKRANMSVGSLYQYFPNKFAIISELFNLWLMEARQNLQQLSQLPKQHPNSSNAELIQVALDDFYSEVSYNEEQLKLEQELVKASDLYSELAELDSQQAQVIATILADLFIQLGATIPKTELLDLGLYLYTTHNCVEQLVSRNLKNYPRIIKWHKQSLHNVIVNNCF